MISAELTPEKDVFLSPYTKVPDGVMEPSTRYAKSYRYIPQALFCTFEWEKI
jgi:hypothetical protein